MRPVLCADRADILRINAAHRPAVAALDRNELERLLALSEFHRVAVDGKGDVVAYMLVFTRHSAYDGEEFRFFRERLREPFLYVDQLAVDERHRRSGVGRRMYEALAELAGRRQIGWLCCEVNDFPPNPASLDFHQRLGFTVIGNGDTLDGRRVSYLLKKI